MPIDASIPLSIRPPEFTPPIQTIGNLMAIKGQIGELAYRQAQAQQLAEQTANEEQQRIQRERTNQSVMKLTSLMQDPNVQKAIGKGDFSPFQNAGISPDVYDPVVQHIQTAQEKAQTLRGTDAKYYAEGRARLGSILEGLDPKDDAKAADQFNSARLALASEHPELAGQLPTLAPGPNLRNQLNDIGVQNGLYHSILENQADISKKAAETSEATARAKQAETAAQESQIKINMMKGLQEPGALESQVGAVINPQLHPQQYQDALQLARSAMHTGDPAKVHEAIHEVYDKQIGAVQAQKAMAPGEVSLAAQKAQAEIPAKIAGEVGAAKAIAGIGPEAFKNVIGADREPAIKATTDAQANYAQAVNDTQKVLDTIASEKANNKVAGSALMVDQARSMIANGRQLGSVLNQVSRNAGNLGDTIEGRLKGLAGTDHIPSDIVKSIGAYTAITQQAAKRKYQADLQNLKLRNVDVSKLPDPSVQQHQIGDRVKTPDGKVGIFKGLDSQGNAIVDVP